MDYGHRSMSQHQESELCRDPIARDDRGVALMKRLDPMVGDEGFSVLWEQVKEPLIWLRYATTTLKLMHRGMVIKEVGSYSDTSAYLSCIDSAMEKAQGRLDAYRIDADSTLELVLELEIIEKPCFEIEAQQNDHRWPGIRVLHIFHNGYYYYDEALYQELRSCRSMNEYLIKLQSKALGSRLIEPREYIKDKVLWSSSASRATARLSPEVDEWISQERQKVSIHSPKVISES